MISRRFFPFIFLFIYSITTIAQEIPIGTWRDHLPYTDAVSVTKNGNLVYCAANSGIFIYDNEDHSIEKLNLVNGLSDIGINKIKYIPYNNRIIVGYKNGNVDIILEDKTIYNLPFIKNNSTIGSKTINHIEIVNELAYLSTGIGIVVLNTEKLEFSDTYNYSPTGSIKTNAVTFDDTNIYAASDDGVYFANKNSLNLTDFNYWSKITALGNSIYSNIVFFENQLFTSYRDPNPDADTLFINNNGTWEKFPTVYTPKNITGLSISKNKLIEISNNSLNVYDNSLSFVEQISNISSFTTLNANEAIISADNYYWIADQYNGLIKLISDFNGESIAPEGPSNATAFNMDFYDNELWIVAGGYDASKQVNLVNHKSNNDWKKMGSYIKDANGDIAKDMVNVAINPSNKSNIYVSSWNSGIYEYNNNTITNRYNAQNSVLDSTHFGSTATGALTFDEDNNLWIASSYSTDILAVKTPNNSWYSYPFTGISNPNYNYTDIIIDDNNYKWITVEDYGRIIVFDDNETLDILNDDQKKILTPSKNNIEGSGLRAIAKDLDGEIWIGTDKGISVFYNPSEVFDTEIKAERIYIEQDGQTQILLEREVITAITIDGANRKWIGTQTSGIYLMSADGTEEIAHFTRSNSPLFSNNILSIAINHNNGEVYIGTESGLLSYKGTATETNKDFNNVLVYPNPVREDFTGTIAIRGLVKDTDLRITDISGNIVYQTTSIGGQATWDGNDMYGTRVKTGVYLLFNGSKDGEKKHAAKILFIH